MAWRNAKVLLGGAVALAVLTRVAKTVLKRLAGSPAPTVVKGAGDDGACAANLNDGRREVNDVLMFPDSQHTQKLIRYVRSARHTLDVCMYLLTSAELAEHVIRLGARHVMVRVLVDGDVARAPGSQASRLHAYSFITVQYSRNSRLMHHKFCIIDGPEAVKRKCRIVARATEVTRAATRGHNSDDKDKVVEKIRPARPLVMSGSLNWCEQALRTSCDSVIVTSQPLLVRKYEREFAGLWREADCTEK